MTMASILGLVSTTPISTRIQPSSTKSPTFTSHSNSTLSHCNNSKKMNTHTSTNTTRMNPTLISSSSMSASTISSLNGTSDPNSNTRTSNTNHSISVSTSSPASTSNDLDYSHSNHQSNHSSNHPSNTDDNAILTTTSTSASSTIPNENDIESRISAAKENTTETPSITITTNNTDNTTNDNRSSNDDNTNDSNTNNTTTTSITEKEDQPANMANSNDTNNKNIVIPTCSTDCNSSSSTIASSSSSPIPTSASTTKTTTASPLPSPSIPPPIVSASVSASPPLSPKSKQRIQNLISQYIPCPVKSHWSTTYDANNPCEDRYASLSNVILTPKTRGKRVVSDDTNSTLSLCSKPKRKLPSSSSSSSSSPQPLPLVYRMSLFTVLDGHGGAAVSDYASKELLPLMARNIQQSLDCDFISSGCLNINGCGSHGSNCSGDVNVNGNGNGRSSASNASGKPTTRTTSYSLDENCYLVKNMKHKKGKGKRSKSSKSFCCNNNSNTMDKNGHDCMDTDIDIDLDDDEDDNDSNYDTDHDDSDDSEDDETDDEDFEEDDIDENKNEIDEEVVGDHDNDHDTNNRQKHQLERWYQAPDVIDFNEDQIKPDHFDIDVNDDIDDDSDSDSDSGDENDSDCENSNNACDHDDNNTDNNEDEMDDCRSEQRKNALTSPMKQELPTTTTGKGIRSVSDDITLSSQQQQQHHPQTVTDSSSSSSSDSSTGTSTEPQQQKHQQQRSIHGLSTTIQKTFIEFDEDWINSINPEETKQSFLVHNGKWNAGACCLVAIILQPLEPTAHSSSLLSTSDEDQKYYNDKNTVLPWGDDDNDNDDEEDDGDNDEYNNGDKESFLGKINEGYQPGKAILYTANAGDCRAMLLTKNNSNTIPSNDNNDDSSSCSSSDSDYDETGEDVIGVTYDHERHNLIRESSEFFSSSFDQMQKRPLIITSNNGRPNKRRRLYSWGDDDHDSVDIHLTSTQSSFSEMSDMTNFEPSALPKKLHAIALTEDHTPYNLKEANLVRKRSNYDPRAISSSSSGGIQRVAGSLSVTRALGDAYLKTPTLSFHPYKDHAPYITALPEVKSRTLDGKSDRILVLASDGVWERVNEENVKHYIEEHYKERNQSSSAFSSSSSFASKVMGTVESNFINSKQFHRRARMRMLPTRSSWKNETSSKYDEHILAKTKVSDAIVSSVLNKVRKRHQMESISALMDLPKGYDRRAKHDDITNMVIDLEGFVL